MRIVSLTLVTVLNAFLRKKLPPELFERLAGREVAIEVGKPALRASLASTHRPSAGASPQQKRNWTCACSCAIPPATS